MERFFNSLQERKDRLKKDVKIALQSELEAMSQQFLEQESVYVTMSTDTNSSRVSKVLRVDKMELGLVTVIAKDAGTGELRTCFIDALDLQDQLNILKTIINQNLTRNEKNN